MTANVRVIRRGPRDNAGDYNFENIEFHRSSASNSIISNNRPSTRYEDGCITKLLSSAFIHGLEAILAAVLSPLTMWQWLSSHEHFMVVLRIVIEVILELIMLIVFAGVSILTAAALVLEDAYDEKAKKTNDEINGKAQEKESTTKPDLTTLTKR